MWNRNENQIILTLIRHGRTKANGEHRYLGKTEEALSAEGREYIESFVNQHRYPEADKLFTSSMKRCKETAAIIYPRIAAREIQEWDEKDFGIFEGKNYTELSDTPEYPKCIESNGKDRFPGGDDPFEFRRRCTEGFIKLIDSCQDDEVISLVVHGGVIMSVMETLAFPGKDFYEWHVSNGHGYVNRFYKGKIADKNKKNCHLTVISMI